MSIALVHTEGSMASSSAQEVGRLMAEARTRARLTQQQVADQVGVTVTQVSRWERGVADPRIEHLERYADVTRTPLRHFFPRPQSADGQSLEEMVAQLLEETRRVGDAVERLADRLNPEDNGAGRS